MKWSLTEYNLIVVGVADYSDPIFRNSSGRSTIPAERLFKYTAPELGARYQDDLAGLGELPTLVLAELGHFQRTPAFFGRVDNVQRLGRDIHFQFQHLFDGLSSEDVFHCGHFDIFTRDRGIDERSHQHWAVKEGNLIEGLFRLLNDRTEKEAPRLFNVEQWPLPPLGHIAVMMPFDAGFNPVYEAIKSACESQRFKSLRVDEIYKPTQIISDVFSAIAQSRLVISDLTSRNPNVLYETGLAHALNRDVIMIVQDEQDVPFDLRHIRYVQYLPNREGLEKLKSDLAEYIQASEVL